MPSQHVHLILLTLVAGLLLAPATWAEPPAASPTASVEPNAAIKELDQLGKFLGKSRTPNPDILAYLDLVFEAYGNFQFPEEPKKPADDAPEEEQKDYASAMKAHEAEVRRLGKLQEGFKKDARKLLLKAYSSQKIKNDTNLRDEVNIRAAKIIGDLAPRLSDDEKKDVAGKLEKALEGLRKTKYRVSTDVLDGGFQALAKLNMPRSLKWMRDNFIHTKKQPSEVDRLQAAHKAMVMFKDVPGKVRYEIVADMIKIYPSTESTAETSSKDPSVLAVKEFWDRIRVDAIRVVSYFAGEPTDDQGQAYNKMQDLQDWFRDHKSPRKAPWVDPKPAK